MIRPHLPPPSLPHASSLPQLFAAGVVLLQLAVTGRYGIFRDELYYLACADHLAWGYVDHPPLSIFALAMWKAVAGDGLLALRIPGAMLNGAAAVLAALLAREMGGMRLAQLLAAVAVGLMPGVLAVGGFYSMNSLDICFWLVAAVTAARLLRGGGPNLWLLLGATIGLGLLNKHSVVLLLGGLALGFLLWPQRARLRERQLWLGAALAIALVLPHIVWQIQNGWPTVEFVQNARELKLARLSAGGFWRETLLMMHPLAAPLAALGLGALLLGRRLRAFRPLGVAAAAAIAVIFIAHGKPYYTVAAWTLAMAAGATALEALLWRGGRAVRRAAGGAYIALLIGGGLAIAPLAIPILPVDRLLAYQSALGIAPASGERHEQGALPQHFADRFGWDELAWAVSDVVALLPPEERASCLIIAANYGEAGAVRYFGRQRRLPPVASGHNSFHLWGLPPGGPWRAVVAVGFSEQELRHGFEQVEEAGRHREELAMPYQADMPIHVCRGWRITPAQAWALMKRYI